MLFSEYFNGLETPETATKNTEEKGGDRRTKEDKGGERRRKTAKENDGR